MTLCYKLLPSSTSSGDGGGSHKSSNQYIGISESLRSSYSYQLLIQPQMASTTIHNHHQQQQSLHRDQAPQYNDVLGVEVPLPTYEEATGIKPVVHVLTPVVPTAPRSQVDLEAADDDAAARRHVTVLVNNENERYRRDTRKRIIALLLFLVVVSVPIAIILVMTTTSYWAFAHSHPDNNDSPFQSTSQYKDSFTMNRN